MLREEVLDLGLRLGQCNGLGRELILKLLRPLCEAACPSAGGLLCEPLVLQLLEALFALVPVLLVEACLLEHLDELLKVRGLVPRGLRGGRAGAAAGASSDDVRPRESTWLKRRWGAFPRLSALSSVTSLLSLFTFLSWYLSLSFPSVAPEPSTLRALAARLGVLNLKEQGAAASAV